MTRGERYVLGVGVASAATAGELHRLVDATLALAQIKLDEVEAVATIEGRRDHPAIVGLGLPVVTLTRAELPRPAGRAAVAEPAALRVAGHGAVLVVAKQCSAHATAALARSG